MLRQRLSTQTTALLQHLMQASIAPRMNEEGVYWLNGLKAQSTKKEIGKATLGSIQLLDPIAVWRACVPASTCTTSDMATTGGRRKFELATSKRVVRRDFGVWKGGMAGKLERQRLGSPSGGF